MEQTRLKTAVLGKTGLQITRVGFGAWALGGGGWQFGWGQQDNEDSISAIHHALDLGINWIDTAAAYGFGRSEQVVGRALEGLDSGQRPYVFTKASLVEGPGRTVVHSLKRDSILREAEASLRRLRADAIIDAARLQLTDDDLAAIGGSAAGRLPRDSGVAAGTWPVGRDPAGNSRRVGAR